MNLQVFLPRGGGRNLGGSEKSSGRIVLRITVLSPRNNKCVPRIVVKKIATAREIIVLYPPTYTLSFLHTVRSHHTLTQNDVGTTQYEFVHSTSEIVVHSASSNPDPIRSSVRSLHSPELRKQNFSGDPLRFHLVR